MTQQYDFFLSHNRANKEWTRVLAATLRRNGVKVFFDEDCVSYGEDIVSAIEKGLKNSRHVVLILSPDSVKSHWVELEWATSIFSDPSALSRKLVPVLLEECDIPWVIKRLRYIDATNKNLDFVSTELQSLINEKQEISNDIVKKFIAHFMEPLPFGSQQYIRRSEDTRVEVYLNRTESVFLYGPRKIGKTSMLHQIFARETLREKICVWIDLQPYPVQDDSFIDYFGEAIARQANVQWVRTQESPSLNLLSFLRKISTTLGDTKLIIFIDEIDILHNSPINSRFTNVLRSVLSDPICNNICCVCAGLLPPWMWEYSDQALVSPWWNLFHLTRLPFFSIENTVELFELVGSLDQKLANDLYNITGGHPFLVSSVLSEIVDGQDIKVLTENIMGISGLFVELPRHMIDLYKHLTKRGDGLEKILRNERIDELEEREIMWITGIIRDPLENPPVISGKMFLDAIKLFLPDDKQNFSA